MNSVSKRITINLGNYENLILEATVSYVDDKEGVWEAVDAQLKRQAQKAGIADLSRFGIS